MSATLEAKARQKVGSRQARYLRLAGRIPCSIQGEGKDNVAFSIDEREFLAARRHHEHLFDLTMEGGEDETGIVRELQWGPFSDRILHVEFRRVIRGKETEAEVAVEFRGQPKGGVLNHVHSHITIRAIPSLIPDSIIVKVGTLEEGAVVHASDLELVEGVSLAVDPELLIATVSSAAGAEATPEDEQAEEGEAGAAPAPGA